METKYPRLVVNQQRALAGLRIYLGLFFLYSAWGKLSAKWIGGFGHMIATQAAASPPPPFFASFLHDLVVPNATTFAYLVVLGELGAGACLVLGLFTGPAAVAAMVMNANYLLLTVDRGIAPVGLNLSFLAMELAVAFGHAGTTWGLDARLVDKAPWWTQGFLHHEYREF